MSDSEIGKLSRKAVLILVVKTLLGAIREEEAQLLLVAFGLRAPATVSQRMDRIEERMVEDGSLKFAALYYQKDPRTIRRWCEKGFFPSAFRTHGKHWRIPFSRIQEAEARMGKRDYRKQKTIFGTPEWQNLRARLKRMLRGISTAQEIEAALRDLDSTDFRKEICPISDSSVELLRAALKNGTVAAVRIRAAARRLKAESPTKRITVGSLAAEMHLSRASLYRRPFGAEAIEAAIRSVE